MLEFALRRSCDVAGFVNFYTNLLRLPPLSPASLSKWKDRISLDTLRPLPMFLGVTGPAFCISAQAFNPPSSRLDKNAAEKIGSRLRLNISFFISNYALIFVGTAFVVSLMHPVMLLSMAIVFGLWYAHFFVERTNPSLEIQVINVTEILNSLPRSAILTVITIIVGLFKCFVPLLQVVGIAGTVIMGHAALRDPQHIETNDNFGGSRRRGSADSDEEYEPDEGGDFV